SHGLRARRARPSSPSRRTKGRAARRPRAPCRRSGSRVTSLVAEAGVRLDADDLVTLIQVLDVDDPEAAGTELRGLRLAHGSQDLTCVQHVARPHRLVE